MSLFGALGIGITGINAQSTKIGSISDNIANVNTVGYKATTSRFASLITSEGPSLYSTQGVSTRNVAQISKQGLLQGTQSTTDIAISGDGFFIVNSASDGSGQLQYTRAGSFSADQDGYFKNTAGLFLQAWVLDSNGDVVDENNLTTINVSDLSSDAVATTDVSIGANLDASQSLLAGAGVEAALDQTDSVNAGLNANQILIPSSVNDIARGDQFNITTGSGGSYDYTYGGFTIGRNIADGTSAGNGDSNASVLSSPVALAANPFQTVGSGSGDVIVTVASTSGLSVGSVVTFSGATAVGGITAAQLNTSFVITQIDDDTHFRVTTAGTDPAVGGTIGGGASVSEEVRPFAGNIFDASTIGEAFFNSTNISTIHPDALSFTITTASAGTVTFTYKATSINAGLGQFNSLNTLAAAIETASGLEARVVNGRLYVGATDSNEAVTFANGRAAGDEGPPLLYGLDWVGELGLADVASGTNRFANLASLESIIDASTGLTASIISPLGSSSISIAVSDPTDTITFSDRAIPADITLAASAYTTTAGSNVVTIAATLPAGLQAGDIITLSGLAAGSYNGIADTDLNGSFVVQSVGAGSFTIATNATASGVTAGSFGAGGELFTPPTNSGSLLGQLGITASLAGGGFPATNPTPTTGLIAAAYDPTDDTANMAGGIVVPQYSRIVTIYDSLGNAHDLTIGFVKTDVNTWAVELYLPSADIIGSASGQVAYGSVTFNGDATLASIDAGLTDPVAITWSNTADASSISFDWGTAGPIFGTVGATVIGQTDGLQQYDSNYNLGFLHQNGIPVGDLESVIIDEGGDVIATFSNGQSQALYRIPLAKFVYADNLQAYTNNAFLETELSGSATWNAAGTEGAGVISPSHLETSNADLNTELVDMIVAQRAYQFNTKVISTTDDILQSLVDL